MNLNTFILNIILKLEINLFLFYKKYRHVRHGYIRHHTCWYLNFTIKISFRRHPFQTNIIFVMIAPVLMDFLRYFNVKMYFFDIV